MPKLALLQSRAHAHKEQALTAHIALIKEAAAAGAEIVVTQELFLTEYFCQEQLHEHFDLAEPIDSATTQRLEALCARLDIVLVASVFERAGAGLYYNTALIFDGQAGLIGSYRKSHIPQDPGFEEKFYFTPGDSNWPVWQTRHGTIGVLICWDQWFPEAARLLALKGAEILLYPTAIGRLETESEQLGAQQRSAWQSVQRGHAVANGCYVAAVNRVGTEGSTRFWGSSFLANPYGELIAEASGEQEEILFCDYQREAVEEFRRIWPFFRDRRPQDYQDLLKQWRA